jgi:hypothetical protein
VEELNKILVTPRPSIGFRLLDETGLLDYVLPQLEKLKGVETVEGKGHKENFSHTLEVLDNVAALENAAIAEGKLKDYVFEDGEEVERSGPNLMYGSDGLRFCMISRSLRRSAMIPFWAGLSMDMRSLDRGGYLRFSRASRCR